MKPPGSPPWGTAYPGPPHPQFRSTGHPEEWGCRAGWEHHPNGQKHRSKNRRWPKLRGTKGSSEPGRFYFQKGIWKTCGVPCPESKDKFFSLSYFPAYAHTLSCCSRVWLFATLRITGSFVHGTLQARILEWVTMPSSRGSSLFRNLTPVSFVSCIASRVLTHWATWEAPCFRVFKQKT